MPPVDPSTGVTMGYPRNLYSHPNMNPNLHPAAMARMRQRGRDWDSDMNDQHDREHEREPKRPRTAMGVPPGPYPINPPPNMLRPPFNPAMYPGALANPSQMPMQPPGQPQHSSFGKPSGPSHLHAHVHVHPPAMPFHQRRPMAGPHSAMPMGGVPQQPYPFPQQKSSFPRGPPQPLPLSADRLPAPPRKSPASAAMDPSSPSVGRPSSTLASQRNSSSSPRQVRRSNGPESFKEFLARQPDTISPVAAKDAYDQYVRDFTKHSPNTFFDLHMHEEWFRERYDPDYVFTRVQRVKKECQDRASDYRKLWDRGGSIVCAPDISSNVLAAIKEAGKGKDKEGSKPSKDEDDEQMEDETLMEGTLATRPDVLKDSDDPFVADKLTTGESGSEEKSSQKNPSGSPKNIDEDNARSDNNIQNENLEERLEVKQKAKESDNGEMGQNEEMGELKADRKDDSKDDPVKKDCDMKEEAKEEESQGDGDALKNESKEELTEEKSSPKEEAVLDNSGAMDEENSEGELDSNLEQDNGKQSDENHDKGEEIAPQSDAPRDGDGGNKSEGECGEHQEGDDSSSLVLPLRREHEKNTIFLRGIPINLAREDLTKVLAHGPNGDMDLQLRRVKIGDINPTRSLQRFAWAVYADEVAAARALNVVKGVLVKTKRKKPKNADQSQDGHDENKSEDAEKDVSSEYVIDCMLNLERKKKYTQGRVLPDLFGSLERMALDLKQSVQIMRCLDKSRELLQELNPLTEEFVEKMTDDGRRLDHIITYLREVHYYCYYSGNEFLEDATSMPPQELRPVLKNNESKGDSDMRMLKRVDERTKWVLERDYDRPRSNSSHAEKEKAEAVEKWLNDNTINEGQGRFRCKLPPNKLFKAPEFVHKHLKTRHADRMKAVMEKAVEDVYRQNFENDPSKDEVIAFYNEGCAGSSSERGPPNQRRSANFNNSNPRESGEYAPGTQSGPMRSTASAGMFNPTQTYMDLGMPQMPMMMMPGSNFPYANTMGFGRGISPGNMGGRMESTDMGRGNMMRPPAAGPPATKGDIGIEHGMWRGGGNPSEGGGMGPPGMGPGPGPGPVLGPKGGGMPMAGGPPMAGPVIGGNRPVGRGGGSIGHGHGGHGQHGHHGHHGGRGGGYDGGLRSSQFHRGRRGGGRRGRHDHGESLDPRALGPRRNYTDLDAPAQGPSFDLVRYDDV